MAERKYDGQEVIKLMTASAGRCLICNADVMTDWLSHKKVKTAELAHIKAFSDYGPRADNKLTEEQRNSADNLMVLCPTHHAAIDKKIAEGVYTVDWLKRTKQQKEEMIRKVLSKLNLKNHLFIKCSSAIGNQNFNFNDDEIFISAFNNGFYTQDEIVNICEDCNFEDLTRSKKTIDDKFGVRVQRIIDNEEPQTICLFACAPQPLLIYLGAKFNDKQSVNIFTRHRNCWRFNEKNGEDVTFAISKPGRINKKNKAVLILSVTSEISDDRITAALGKSTDIWRLSSSKVGVDIINNQPELQNFYQTCVSAIDQIGNIYGKDVEINVFPSICNSLALTFGRVKFVKSHNKLKIFDIQNINGLISFVEVLSI